MLRLLVFTAATTRTYAELVYQGAQAPPPSASNCQAWCPTTSCCTTCDIPSCNGCGLKRDCTGTHSVSPSDGTAGSSDLGTNSGFATSSSKTPKIVTPIGFQTGQDGHLYADGKRFIVKGVNWWGLEGPERCPGGLALRGMDEIFDFIADNGFNAMRTLVNHHNVMVNGKLAPDSFDEGRNPDLVNKKYLEVLEALIEEAATRNILVMVNVHRTIPTAWPGEGLWYDSHVSESDAILSWRKLARTLCNHWNVFAADLVNEPVKASWGRNSPLDWNKAAERIGNAVLDECPRLLIFVQGISGNPGAPGDGGESEGYFWGENFVGVKTAPVRIKDMSKLVYSPHAYGPGVYANQPYFPTCSGSVCVHQRKSFPSNMADIWDRHFGFAAQESKQAIVVGEFGGKYDSVYDKQWQDAFVDYLITRGFGAFYFGLNPDSADTGGLFYKDWHTPVSEKLRLIARLPSTQVLSLMKPTSDSPSPPPPRPQSPHPPPPPLFSDALLALLMDSPFPPPYRWPSPPPPPWFPARHIGLTPASELYYDDAVYGDDRSFETGVQQDVVQEDHDQTLVWTAVVTVSLVCMLVMGIALTWFKPTLVSRLGELMFRKSGNTQMYMNARPGLNIPGMKRLAPRAKKAGRTRKEDEEECALNSPLDYTSSNDLENPEESEGRPLQDNAHVAGARVGQRLHTKADDLHLRDQYKSSLLGSHPLTPGTRVRIHGLKAAVEQNGKEGVIIGRSEGSSGRHKVRLDSGEMLALKSENLLACGAPPNFAAMVAALERAGEHEKADLLRQYASQQ